MEANFLTPTPRRDLLHLAQEPLEFELVSYFSNRLDPQNLADEARIDLVAPYMLVGRLRQLEQV